MKKICAVILWGWVLAGPGYSQGSFVFSVQDLEILPAQWLPSGNPADGVSKKTPEGLKTHVDWSKAPPGTQGVFLPVKGRAEDILYIRAFKSIEIRGLMKPSGSWQVVLSDNLGSLEAWELPVIEELRWSTTQNTSFIQEVRRAYESEHRSIPWTLQGFIIPKRGEDLTQETLESLKITYE